MNRETKVLGFVPFSKAGNLLGGLMIAVSMTLFVTNDSIMRSLQQANNPFGAEALPLPMVIAIRGTLVVLLLSALITAQRQPLFPRAMASGWNWVRALIEASITVLFLSALPHIPLAAAETFISASPIFLVLLGIFLFGERVGWRRWLAIAFGFGGMVLTSLALDDGGFDPVMFRWWAIPFCLICAVLVALRDVATRYISNALAPTSIALSSAIAVMVLGWSWSWSWRAQSLVMPDGYQLFLLACSALLVMGAYLTAVFAVRLGAFAVIGPLRFVSLIAAFLFGTLLFKDPFSWLGVWGAVLIVGSALWIVYREHRTKQG